jgi:flagellar hook-associated protein 3 FlgL
MLSPVNGATQNYLDDLDRIQSRMNDVQRQVSSGVRVGVASDDPLAVPGILESVSRIARNTQTLTNLNQVKSELASGESALQSTVTVLEQAISLGAQAASTQNASQRAVLIQQAQGIMQQMVDLSRTSVNGRYIFSGDLDRQPLYSLDATQPEGVAQLATAKSTVTVTDGGGAAIWVPRTAQDIFDLKNPNGTPASGNVFAAVNSLLLALQNNDPAAAGAAVDSLKAADDHVNQELGLNGIAQNRLADAVDGINNSLVTEKQNLSVQRDTDVAAAAIELSQVSVQQQAALSVGAKLSKLNLFDYLA